MSEETLVSTMMPITCREMPLLLMNDYYKMLLPVNELSGGPYSVFTMPVQEIDIDAPACFDNGNANPVTLSSGRYEGREWEFWNSVDMMPLYEDAYRDLHETFPQRSWNLSGCTLSAYNFYDQYWKLHYYYKNDAFFGKISPSGECIGLSSLNLMPWYGYTRRYFNLYDDHTYRLGRNYIRMLSKDIGDIWSEGYKAYKMSLTTVNPYFPHALERGGRTAYTSRYYNMTKDDRDRYEREYALANQNLMRPQNSNPFPVSSSIYDPALNEFLYDSIANNQGENIFNGKNSIWDDYTIQNNDKTLTWKIPPTTKIKLARDWGYDLKQMIDRSDDGMIYKADQNSDLHLAWNRDKMNWLKDFDIVRIYWNTGMIDHSTFQAGALYEEGRFIFGFKEKALDGLGHYEVEYYRPQ